MFSSSIKPSSGTGTVTGTRDIGSGDMSQVISGDSDNSPFYGGGITMM